MLHVTLHVNKYWACLVTFGNLFKYFHLHFTVYIILSYNLFNYCAFNIFQLYIFKHIVSSFTFAISFKPMRTLSNLRLGRAKFLNFSNLFEHLHYFICIISLHFNSLIFSYLTHLYLFTLILCVYIHLHIDTIWITYSFYLIFAFILGSCIP